MPLVRILAIFIIGIAYSIFTKGFAMELIVNGHSLGLTVGFTVTTFIFAALVYLISMIVTIPKASEKEQDDDAILDAEYVNQAAQKETNFDDFTKYWLIVAIVIFLIMMSNTIIQPN